MSHIAHWAEHAPCARAVNHREDNAHDERGEHDAVETESELRHPWLYSSGVGPMPWHIESPEQVYGFVQRVHTLCHTHGEDNHLNEKEHEEHEESVSEPLRRKPSWSHFLARPLQGVANLEEELTTAAVVVAVAFTASEYCHQQRNEEADHAKPRKHDVEESEGEVCGRHNP